MMATGFLGYNHSHKWSKFNSNNQNISSFNNKNKTYKNIYLIQKRNYSNYLSYSSTLLPAYSPRLLPSAEGDRLEKKNVSR